MKRLSNLSILWVIFSLTFVPNFIEALSLTRKDDISNYEEHLEIFNVDLNRRDFDLEKELSRILRHDSQLVSEFKPLFMDLLEIGKLNCSTCLNVMNSVDKFVGSPKFEDILFPLATLFCTLAEIFSSRVCKAGVLEWGPHVLNLAKNDVLASQQVCYSVFGPSCANPVIIKANWTLNYPDTPKPAYVVPTSPPEGVQMAKVLHLSDIHMDISYEEGANAHCHDPLCCRGIDGFPISAKWAAGKYGSLAYCDTPLATFEALLSNLSTQNFDWILVTGDLPAHDVYNQTKEDNAYVIGLINDLLWKYFPTTPVLQALGNHGSAPVDQYIPPYMDAEKSPRPMGWLYDTLAEKWLRWLPESTRDTIKSGAFWSWDFIPGLKVVSLNSGYGQSADWYTSINNTDVHGMLQWMINELQDAEDRNLKVWILTHHPHFTLDYYKQKFDEIVHRYINVIVGWFNGHTHKDEMRVIYDPTINGGTPVLTGFVAPSVTTYSDTNMAYRVYYVDSKRENATFRVADYDTYYMNVTDVNNTGNVVWNYEYSFKKAYNMTSLLPVDFDNLLSRMLQDSSLAQDYVNYFYKSTSFHTCDSACAKDIVKHIKVPLLVSGTYDVMDQRF